MTREDYGGEEEPNMKLSHAFMVVLVLHVDRRDRRLRIQLHQGRPDRCGQIHASGAVTESAIAKEAVTTPVTTTAAAPAATLDGWKGKTHTVAANETLSRIATTYKTTIEAIGKGKRHHQLLCDPGGPGAENPRHRQPKRSQPKETATKQAFIATKTDTGQAKLKT